MISINPYINFNGNAEEAFNFYKSIFGGEFGNIIRFKDLAGENFKVSPEEEEKIMQISLPIGDTTLVANDVPPFMGKVNESENRSKILVKTDNLDDANRIFEGLSEGASVEAPMGAGPWGTTFGMLRDKYGIEWMIEHSVKKI